MKDQSLCVVSWSLSQVCTKHNQACLLPLLLPGVVLMALFCNSWVVGCSVRGERMTLLEKKIQCGVETNHLSALNFSKNSTEKALAEFQE